MQSWVYLLSLTAGIVCMLVIDRRFKLFFWSDPAAAGLVAAAGVGFLLLWDAAGIAAGIFIRGDSEIATGVVIAPELPLEEPVFLVFLVLCTMVLYTGSARILANRARARKRASEHRGPGGAA